MRDDDQEVGVVRDFKAAARQLWWCNNMLCRPAHTEIGYMAAAQVVRTPI